MGDSAELEPRCLFTLALGLAGAGRPCDVIERESTEITPLPRDGSNDRRSEPSAGNREALKSPCHPPQSPPHDRASRVPRSD